MSATVTPIRKPKSTGQTEPTISLARGEEALSRAFELVHRSYYQSGLSVDIPSGLRLTPYHLSDCSDVLIAKLRSEVVSTISLFGDGEMGLPMESMYQKEVDQLRGRGLKLGEIGSFADRRRSVSRFLQVFVEFNRWLAQVGRARGIDTLVVAVHPKHGRLYKRAFGFQQIGELMECPYANGNPAVAMYLELDHLDPKIDQQVFGTPMQQQHLEAYHWEPKVKQHFARVFANDGKIADVVKLKGYYDWTSPTCSIDRRPVPQPQN